MSKETGKVMYDIYLGYLVGGIREILEASVSDPVQLKALKGIMDDKVYGWWDKCGNEFEIEYLQKKLDAPIQDSMFFKNKKVN